MRDNTVYTKELEYKFEIKINKKNKSQKIQFYDNNIIIVTYPGMYFLLGQCHFLRQPSIHLNVQNNILCNIIYINESGLRKVYYVHTCTSLIHSKHGLTVGSIEDGSVATD